MDKVFEFVGTFLTKLCEGGGGLGLAVTIFALLVTVFALFTIISEIRSLQLADLIRPLHEGILNKFKNKPDQMAKELIGMHKTFGYNTFLGTFSQLIHIIVVVLLAGTFFQPERYLHFQMMPGGSYGSVIWRRPRSNCSGRAGSFPS